VRAAKRNPAVDAEINYCARGSAVRFLRFPSSPKLCYGRLVFMDDRFRRLAQPAGSPGIRQQEHQAD